MKKQIWSLIAPLITFGPVFMVITGGGYSSGPGVSSHLIMFAGALMLSIGLAAMFKTITKQQNLIEKLQADLRPNP
jgi:hypothetical protein